MWPPLGPDTGKTIRMPLTYAVGDIHGSLDKLQTLVSRCREHADGRAMTLVFLGDYIDRGPQSADVVRFLVELQSLLGEHVIPLMGNHEAMALAAIDGTLPALDWLVQGGAATLRSYGVGRAGELPRQDVDWLRSLHLTYDDGRRLFVHAGIDPRIPLDRQNDFNLLWIREPFLSEGRRYDRLIVHGHTPLVAGTPDLRSNRLNLDTGAVFGGPLTAAVFNDAQTEPISYLQAR
jgi:Calcineurin-like phosphoesterase